MENVSQSNIDILEKGLEIAFNRYNEELKRGKAFNKRAMYPLSIIPVIFTIISFFLNNLQNFLIEKHQSWIFCIVLIICILYVLICVCFIRITIPKSYRMISASSPKVFCKNLDETLSIVAYYQLLIPQYVEDYNTLYKNNEKKGRYLKYMNILFIIIILLFMIILTLTYF
jgi:MFS family permease